MPTCKGFFKKKQTNVHFLVKGFQFTVFSSQFSVHSFQFTVFSSQFSVHSFQFTVFNSQFSVHSFQFTVFSSQFSVHSFQFTVFSSQFSVSGTRKPPTTATFATIATTTTTAPCTPLLRFRCFNQSNHFLVRRRSTRHWSPDCIYIECFSCGSEPFQKKFRVFRQFRGLLIRRQCTG